MRPEKSPSNQRKTCSMSFEVIATEPFERKLKKLAKKYRSLSADLVPVIEQLAEEPDTGTSLGKNCYKVRIAIASKGKGKSGGARLITYIRVARKTVFLLDIYDKSAQDTISGQELELFIALLAD